MSLVQILANFAYFLFVKGLGEGLRLARRRASKDRSIEGKLAEVVDRLSLLMITMMMRMVLVEGDNGDQDRDKGNTIMFVGQ